MNPRPPLCRGILLGVALVALSACPAGPTKDIKNALGRWKNAAPTVPKWDYLTVFRSKLTLPSLVVGSSGELSSGCLQPSDPTSEKAGNDIVLKYKESQKTKAGLVASLEATIKEAAKIGGSADLGSLSQAADQWTVQLSELEYVVVDPASARPNFKNPACTVPALQWFVKDRAMVVGALRAKKATLTRTAGISDQLKGALKAAASETTGTVKGNLGLSLSDLVEEEGKISIQANNIFFAVRSTDLATRVCAVPGTGGAPLKVMPGQWITLCDYFKFKFSPVAGDKYKYKIERPGADTVEYLASFDERKMVPLDEIHLVGPRVSKDSGTYELDFYGFLVGPKGGR